MIMTLTSVAKSRATRALDPCHRHHMAREQHQQHTQPGNDRTSGKKLANLQGKLIFSWLK